MKKNYKKYFYQTKYFCWKILKTNILNYVKVKKKKKNFLKIFFYFYFYFFILCSQKKKREKRFVFNFVCVEKKIGFRKCGTVFERSFRMEKKIWFLFFIYFFIYLI